MDDKVLMDAYAELRALLANPDCPERVKTACLGLSKIQTKLFCAVPNSYRTEDGTNGVENAGALDLGMRLEPSNFLCELLAALRALDWPKVMVLVHGALPNFLTIDPSDISWAETKIWRDADDFVSWTSGGRS